MKIPNLKNMSANVLIDLRNDIDRVLAAKVAAERKELRAKLDKLERFGRPGRGGAGFRSHPLKGGKIAPRFRGPGGETWSGRGLRPKWLTALVSQGHKPEEYALEKSTPGGAAAGRKPTRKRSRK